MGVPAPTGVGGPAREEDTLGPAAPPCGAGAAASDPCREVEGVGAAPLLWPDDACCGPRMVASLWAACSGTEWRGVECS